MMSRSHFIGPEVTDLARCFCLQGDTGIAGDPGVKGDQVCGAKFGFENVCV